MSMPSPITIKSKKWRYYEPKVAYTDTSNPLGLALAGTTVKELEHLTRGVWTRINLKSYDGTQQGVATQPIDLDVTETATPLNDYDDTEVVSAIIKTCRITRILSPSKLLQNKPLDSTHTSDVVSTSVDASKSESEEGRLSDDEISVASSIDPEELNDFAEDPPISPAFDGIVVDEGGGDSDSDHGPSVGGLSMECPSLAAWERRSELFSRFDEGCIVDRSGWYEVTPEKLAMKIAEKIKRAIAHSDAEKFDSAVAELSEDKIVGPNPAKKARTEETEGNECSAGVNGADSCSNGTESRTGRRRPILAAACGCGGEAIALARCLSDDTAIVAVDIDADKIHRCCEQNARVYGIANKIEFIQEDINIFAKTKAAEIKTIETEIIVDLPPITGVNPIRQKVKRKKIVRPFSWCIMSPPWGGPQYRDKYCFSLGVQTFVDLVKMVQSCTKIADNLCLILPRNQDVDEIVHLACHGMPDGDRFIHVEFDRLTLRSDGYPKMLAVYLCREPCLLLSEPDLATKTEFRSSKLLCDFTKVKCASKPKLNLVRPAFPELTVSYKMLQRKKATDSRLPLESLYNVVFCRFLLGYLEEPTYQIRVLESYLQLIGVGDLLRIVEETTRLTRAGGMKKRTDSNQARTKGGLFFEVLHQNFPEEFRVLRKWRKKFIEALKQQSSGPSIAVSDSVSPPSKRTPTDSSRSETDTPPG